MHIGLLGFGVVGKGVYQILNGRTTEERTTMRVSSVLCLEEISLPDAKVVKSIEDIVKDKDIDTVVEAMGGLHPAYEFVRSALEAGKNVVTSNKALMATFYDDLVPLAQQKGVCLRCTAAVGGGIGWLSELERTRRVQRLSKVGGIMNGTCNYILDNMTRLGLTYDEALKQAQEKGYAERNPSTDVDGIDTWHKLLLSCNIAFGVSMEPETVPVAGIRRITAEDVAQFTAHGYTCKLVSTGILQDDGTVCAYVQPTLFPNGTPESAVPMNYNLITFVGEHSERMSFYGQGAGRFPTAYNVVQDCTDVEAGKGFYAPYGPKTSAVNSTLCRYYVRGMEGDKLAAYADCAWGEATVTKPMAVDEMHRLVNSTEGAFIAAIYEEEI